MAFPRPVWGWLVTVVLLVRGAFECCAFSETGYVEITQDHWLRLFGFEVFADGLQLMVLAGRLGRREVVCAPSP